MSQDIWQVRHIRADGDSGEYDRRYSSRLLLGIPFGRVTKNYQPDLAELMRFARLEPKPKTTPRPDPVKKLSELMGVGRETAQKMFGELENDIDDICKEEKVGLLNPDEKAELILGIIKASSDLAKKISKELK